MPIAKACASPDLARTRRLARGSAGFPRSTSLAPHATRAFPRTCPAHEAYRACSASAAESISPPLAVSPLVWWDGGDRLAQTETTPYTRLDTFQGASRKRTRKWHEVCRQVVYKARPLRDVSPHPSSKWRRHTPGRCVSHTSIMGTGSSKSGRRTPSREDHERIAKPGDERSGSLGFLSAPRTPVSPARASG